MTALLGANQADYSKSIVHEVNQPLCAAMNCADAAVQWLSRANPNVAEATIAVKAAIEAIRHAADVVKSVQRHVNCVEPDLSILSMDVVLSDTLQILQGMLETADILITAEFGCQTSRISGDKALLQQALLNIVTNAIQALRGVDDRARILRISTRRDGAGIVIEVRDNGPGFTPGARVRAFEPFYSTKRDGMGVGLSMSQSIVNAHGGEIRIGAEGSGNGAIIKVSLPALAG